MKVEWGKAIGAGVEVAGRGTQKLTKSGAPDKRTKGCHAIYRPASRFGGGAGVQPWARSTTDEILDLPKASPDELAAEARGLPINPENGPEADIQYVRPENGSWDGR